MSAEDLALLREAVELHETVVTRSALEIRKADLLLEAIFRELARPTRNGGDHGNPA